MSYLLEQVIRLDGLIKFNSGEFFWIYFDEVDTFNYKEVSVKKLF